MELTANILEEFECKVCTEIMHPPIRMCILGHSFCHRCSTRIRMCPICRGPKGQGRNYALESIHNKVMLPCKHYGEGCPITMLGTNIDHHEEFCKFTTTQCPLKTINNCTWSGQLKDLVAHAQAHHPNNTFCTNQQKLLCPGFLSLSQSGISGKNIGDSYCMLFNVFDHVFKFTWDIDLETGILRWCALFCGPKSQAKDYYFKVTFENKGNQREKIELALACQPMQTPVFQEERYIVTHIDVMKRFCRKQNLHYTISICKSNEGQQVPILHGSEEGFSPNQDDRQPSPDANIAPEPSRFYDINDPALDMVRMILLLNQELD